MLVRERTRLGKFSYLFVKFFTALTPKGGTVPIQTGEEFNQYWLQLQDIPPMLSMFLLNFDITIVIDFSHKRDFVETQTEKKVKFVLPHPLGERVSMRK